MPVRPGGMVLLALLITACSSTGSESTTSTTAPPATTQATTTSTAPTTTSTTAAATTTTTAANLVDATTFQAPFVLEKPNNAWSVTYRAEDWAIEISTASQDYLIFTTVGADSVEAWIEKLTTESVTVATEPVATEIGSLPATTFEVRLADGTVAGPGCVEPCFTLFDHRPTPEVAYGWTLFEDLPNRVWLVDKAGIPVAIFAETSPARFEAWVAEVEAGLATLTWSD